MCTDSLASSATHSVVVTGLTDLNARHLGCIGLFGAGIILTFSGKYNNMLLETTHSRLADCACDMNALKPLEDCILKGGMRGEILSRTHYKSLIEASQRQLVELLGATASNLAD